MTTGGPGSLFIAGKLIVPVVPGCRLTWLADFQRVRLVITKAGQLRLILSVEFIIPGIQGADISAQFPVSPQSRLGIFPAWSGITLPSFGRQNLYFAALHVRCLHHYSSPEPDDS